MKNNLYFTLLVLVILFQSSLQKAKEDDNVESETPAPLTTAEMELAKAWKIQCRIKQKGTFTLASIKNKYHELEALKSQIADFKANKENFRDDDVDARASCDEQIAEAETQLEEYEKSREEQLEELQEAQKDLSEQVKTKEQELKTDGPTPEGNAELKQLRENLKEANHNLQLHQNGQEDKNINLFMDDDKNSVELPNVCQARLTNKQILQLGVKACDLKNSWINAFEPQERRKKQHKIRHQVDRKDEKVDIKSQIEFQTETQDEVKITYRNLPPLNKEKFFEFYKAMTSEISSEQSNGILPVTSGDDMDAQNADLQEEIFNIALFGRNREYITWLEFWVYMCTDGIKPNDNEYMVRDDNEILLTKEDLLLFRKNGKMWQSDGNPQTEQPELVTQRRNNKSSKASKQAKKSQHKLASKAQKHRFAKKSLKKQRHL